MPPQFLFFDLGNVLLKFDHHLAARQMAEVAGISESRAWDVVFASDLEARYERGQINDREFYEVFCRQTDSRADYDRLLLASSEIFTPNASIFPVVAALDAAGHRLGILSNTSPAHWAYCIDGRYGLLNLAFDVAALSFEIGACKPDPQIYLAAAKMAGVSCEQIFFVDDIAANVAGARAAGFDAVQYTDTPALVADLRKRAIEFNY